MNRVPILETSAVQPLVSNYYKSITKESKSFFLIYFHLFIFFRNLDLALDLKEMSRNKVDKTHFT